MAINWNLMQQNVDLTGFGQGIARGIEAYGEAKRRKELETKQELKDFESKFDLDKVLDKDSGDIIKRFEELKPLQLEFARLNNTNGNAARLQELNSKIKSIKSGIYDTYSQSKANAALYKEYKDFGYKMTNSGFELPEDYLDTMKLIANSPSSQLAEVKIKSPMEFNFDANDEDLDDLDKTVRAGAKADKIVETGGKKYEVTLEGDDKVEVTEDVIYKMSKPNAVFNLVNGAMSTKNRINNNAVKEKSLLVSNYKLPDNDPNLTYEQNIQNSIKKKMAEKAFNDIKLIAANIGEGGIKIEKPEDIPPALALAYNRNYFNKEQVGTVVNNKELMDKLKVIDKNKQWKYKERSLGMLSQKLNMAKVNQAMSIGNYLKMGGYEMTPWMIDLIDATPYDFYGQLERSRQEYKDLKGGSGQQIVITPNTKQK
jgi:hypothetical protein